MYENELEFLGGRGDAKQKPSVGEYGYYLELHIQTKLQFKSSRFCTGSMVGLED